MKKITELIIYIKAIYTNNNNFNQSLKCNITDIICTYLLILSSKSFNVMYNNINLKINCASYRIFPFT